MNSQQPPSSFRSYRAHGSAKQTNARAARSHRFRHVIAPTPQLTMMKPGSYHASSNTINRMCSTPTTTTTIGSSTINSNNNNNITNNHHNHNQHHHNSFTTSHLDQIDTPLQPSLLVTPLKPQLSSDLPLSTANIPCFESFDVDFDSDFDEDHEHHFGQDHEESNPSLYQRNQSRRNSSTPQKPTTIVSTTSTTVQSPPISSPILSQQLSYYSQSQQHQPSSPQQQQNQPQQYQPTTPICKQHKQQHVRSIPIIEETIPFAQQCTQHCIPQDATFSLSTVSSLLQYVTPGSVVIFDIDDTLIKHTYDSSLLLSQKGTTLFSSYLQSQSCDSMPLEEKNRLLEDLGAYVSCFSLAESDTAHVVQQLQNIGCYVFALTARRSTIHSSTAQTLTSLGINFDKSLPPSLPKSAIDHVTNAVVIDGIIYCNDSLKGVVFQRFMSQQWISFPVIHECSHHTCLNDPQCTKMNQIVTCTAHQNHPGAHHAGLPSCPQRQVWFIDDSYPQIQSMNDEWRAFAQKQLIFQQNLPQSVAQTIPCQGTLKLVCLHYSHPTNYTANPHLNPLQLSPQDTEKVIVIQISHFIKSGEVLTDQAALDILSTSPNWGSCSVGSQTPPSATSPVEKECCEGPQTPTESELILRA